jgi:hypothetical protein
MTGMSGRAALQPALAKLVAFAAVVVVVWILAQEPAAEPGSDPGVPAAREESTRVMDSPELRRGP